MKTGIKNYGDLLGSLFLLIAIWSATTRLTTTDWTDNLMMVQVCAVLGILIGIFIGATRFSKITSRLLMVTFSLFILGWQISKLTSADLFWSEKSIDVLKRVFNSVMLFLNNQPVQESTLFLISMVIIFWFTSLGAGYLLTRYGRPWLPLIIIGVTLLIFNVFPPFHASRHFFSGLFAFSSLLLLGRLFYLKSQLQWRGKGSTIDYGVDFDITRTVAVVGFVIVFLAWNIPYVVDVFTPESEEQQDLRELWKPLQNRLSNAFNSLRRQPGERTDFYGASLALGTRAAQGDDEVFYAVPEGDKLRGFRYYWRSRTYDYYEDGSWRNTIEGSELIFPDEWKVEKPDWDGRQELSFSMQPRTMQTRNIYAPGYLLAVDVAVDLVHEQIIGNYSATQAALITPDPGQPSVSAPALFYDHISAVSRTALENGKIYQVTSWAALPNLDQMRSAGDDYPNWVTDRYLYVPASIPERVKRLAEEITKDQPTNFDKVMEITRFLRTEIIYSDTVEMPENVADEIDWFIFETKEGFCNYYATAEVMMLRSIGIPARLVVGFNEGDYQPEDRTYQVKVKNSHAWPEVYFPGLGWVEFEPTSSIPLPAFLTSQRRGEQDNLFAIEAYLDEPNMASERYEERLNRIRDESLRDLDFEPDSTSQLQPESNKNYWLLVIPLLAAVGFGLSRLKVFRKTPLPVMLEHYFDKRGIQTPRLVKILSHRSKLSLMERYFSELSWMLGLLGKPLAASLTPTEQAELVIKTVPETKPFMQTLLAEFQKDIYSPYGGDIAAARTAYQATWKQVIIKWLSQTFTRE